MLCFHHHVVIKPPDICLSVACYHWKCWMFFCRPFNRQCVCQLELFLFAFPWTQIYVSVLKKRAFKTLKITPGYPSRSFGCSASWGWWSYFPVERALGRCCGPSLNPFRWDKGGLDAFLVCLGDGWSTLAAMWTRLYADTYGLALQRLHDVITHLQSL